MRQFRTFLTVLTTPFELRGPGGVQSCSSEQPAAPAKRISVMLAAGLWIAAGAAPASAQIVNIDADLHCPYAGGAVEVWLEPGVYTLTPIGPPDGAFVAMNVFGTAITGCGPSGGGCERGWEHKYQVTDEARVVVLAQLAGSMWSTPEGAFAAAPTQRLRICTAGTFRFQVADLPCSDNQGGASLSITPADCPADLDLSGSLDFFDFLAFQNLFAAGDTGADFDCSGALDFFDFLAFQNEFAAGCP